MTKRYLKAVRIVMIILTIAWMLLIYLFSRQTITTSNQLSWRFLMQCFKALSHLTHHNYLPFVYSHYSLLMVGIRKCAHIFIFMMLSFNTAMTVLTFPQLSRQKKKIVSLLIGLTYAMTDEFHQMFVFGRTGSPIDIGIDGIGIIIGLTIAFILNDCWLHFDTEKEQ